MNIPRIFNELINGTCFNNFSLKHSDAQLNIVIKTTLVAVATGIVAKAAGLAAPVIFAVAGGVAAFAYFTSPTEHPFNTGADATLGFLERKIKW